MTEPPVDASAVVTDALSEQLNLIRLRGEHIFDSSVTAGGSAMRHTVPALHIITDGAVLIEGQFEDIAAHGGDVVLLARPTPHRVRGDAGGRWLTGTIAYDQNPTTGRLLGMLPPAVVLRLPPDDPRDWLAVSSRLLLQEVTDPLPGGSVMVSRIIDLLFIQTLRAWARTAEGAHGWLGAAMDPHIGPAIMAMHSRPEHPWTIQALAELAHVSRSTFADRFSATTGMAPMHYLAAHRLDRARDLLRDASLPIRHVANQVGYASEAAFSRAFRRRHGLSPLQARQAEAAGSASS